MSGAGEKITVSGGGNYHYNGLLAELIRYNRGLRAAERMRIGAYLARKYGIEARAYTNKDSTGTGFKPTVVDGCVLWLDASAFSSSRPRSG